MGLINREKDLTEQRENFDNQTPVTGLSFLIQVCQVPYSAQLEKVVSSAFGLSGSPILGIQIQRFIPGVGLTTIPVNGSSLLTVTAFSTSGVQTHALPPFGSSLIQVAYGDNIEIVTSGANTAANYAINVVLRCLQDFKSIYTLGSGA